MTSLPPLPELIKQVQVAVMLLTRLPAGRLGDAVPGLGRSVWAFPLAGLAVGLVSGLVLTLALSLGLPEPLAAGLAVMTGILATGGLHEDGLADLADGFGGGATRAARLDIMRDSRIGSYGTLALIIGVGLRWQALTLLCAEGGAIWAVIALAMLSRAAPAMALGLMPAARADGLGHAAALTSRSGGGVAIAIAVICAALLLGPAPVLAVALVIAIVALATCALAMRMIGGQTGDVMGAVQQLAEIAGFLTLAAML
ncbi:adenosylcobinamide-GDP ribazoletransferase [Harenicola maris]|uniref:adenosylcobinamide-GDP ribazoletransferase n=1 Tax=Harenicola maris TaxID=2841044 RepID=UPI002E18C962